MVLYRESSSDFALPGRNASAFLGAFSHTSRSSKIFHFSAKRNPQPVRPLPTNTHSTHTLPHLTACPTLSFLWLLMGRPLLQMDGEPTPPAF